jgi:hypothetical protein
MLLSCAGRTPLHVCRQSRTRKAAGTCVTTAVEPALKVESERRSYGGVRLKKYQQRQQQQQRQGERRPRRCVRCLHLQQRVDGRLSNTGRRVLQPLQSSVISKCYDFDLRSPSAPAQRRPQGWP